MTIIASVKVHDGIVLGADSMTQLIGQDAEGNAGFIQSYQHAQKLHQIGTFPIGVMAFGIGNIGPRSIGSFVSEYSRGLKGQERPTVEAVAKDLSQLLLEAYEPAFANVDPKPDLGVFVAGYSPKKALAEEWEFNIPGKPAPVAVRAAESFGASWRGVSIPFTRLYKGIDPRLGAEIGQGGLTEQQAADLRKKYVSPFIFDGMPIQDAVEFVVFILETTINTAKFEAGVASCGGPLWVAVAGVDTYEWVKKHELRVNSR